MGGSAVQVAQLGKAPDDVLAERFGRTETAVRVRRAKLRIPAYRGRRKRP